MKPSFFCLKYLELAKTNELPFSLSHLAGNEKELYFWFTCPLKKNNVTYKVNKDLVLKLETAEL